MRAYIHILTRLATCWGIIPSEVVVGGLFAAPGIYSLLAGLPYGLSLLVDTLIIGFFTGILRAHVWPDIPPEHREALLALRDGALMRPSGREHLAVGTENQRIAIEESEGDSARDLAPVRLPSMPTVHREGEYRFFFFSNENDEPPHIHVKHGDSVAKFWLENVKLAHNHGFARHRLTRIQSMVEQHREAMLRKWHEYFGT